MTRRRSGARRAPVRREDDRSPLQQLDARAGSVARVRWPRRGCPAHAGRRDRPAVEAQGPGLGGEGAARWLIKKRTSASCSAGGGQPSSGRARARPPRGLRLAGRRCASARSRVPETSPRGRRAPSGKSAHISVTPASSRKAEANSASAVTTAPRPFRSSDARLARRSQPRERERLAASHGGCGKRAAPVRERPCCVVSVSAALRPPPVPERRRRS
jgi:hypothetical protein